MLSRREEYTDQQLLKVVQLHGGNKSEAARSIGVPRKTFTDWLDKLADKVESKIQEKKEKIPRIPLDQCKPNSTAVFKQKPKQILVFTCHQNNTDIHEGFLKSLKSYCEHRDAQLFVIPIRYKNVTAYASNLDYRPQWSPELTEYYLNDTIEINKNLKVFGDFKIQATAESPLSNIGTVSGRYSAIFGHPQIQLRRKPAPMDDLPRLLTTTGSCSVKNYSQSKMGMRAASNHKYGAVVVEVDHDLFWVRQLDATDDGSFYDLDTFYSPDAPPVSGCRVDSVVFGDIHVDFADPKVVEATWGSDINFDLYDETPLSLVKLLRPKHQFLHDVLDFYSANWHHSKNTFIKYAKHHAGTNNVESELQRVVDFHNLYWNDPDCTYHYVASNHNDGLGRWLNDADPKQDPENALFYHKMMAFMLENTVSESTGVSTPNPIEYYLKDKILNPENTLFHGRNKKVLIGDVDHSQHGDRGANGGKGSLMGFSHNAYKMSVGHSHTDGIEKDIYQSGTTSYLGLDYNSTGYSSWINTHIVQYANGKRALYTCINGRFRGDL